MLSWMTPERLDVLVEQLRADHAAAPAADAKEGGL
jgi:hypothetical protein